MRGSQLMSTHDQRDPSETQSSLGDNLDQHGAPPILITILAGSALGDASQVSEHVIKVVDSANAFSAIACFAINV